MTPALTVQALRPEIVEWGDPALPMRFWDKVYPCPITGCWLWGAGSSDGYGYYWHTPARRNIGAHVASYRALLGKRVRKGQHVDHLCRQRACVNPAHLQAVRIGVNVLRGTSAPARNRRKITCDKGHQLAARHSPQGRVWRYCPTCSRDRKRVKYATERGVPVEAIGRPLERCKRDHPLVGPDADVRLDGNRRECRRCRRINASRRRRQRAPAPPYPASLPATA